MSAPGLSVGNHHVRQRVPRDRRRVGALLARFREALS